MLWMHERPQMYCQCVGELDLVLWYLHLAWAKVADRENDYRSALESAGLKPLGILKDDERQTRVDLKDKTTKRVLGFWSKVDDSLGLKVRVPTWHESSYPV
jgi:hypothetical protein